MNTNIENIRLKNGEEYPVSPAYFDGTIIPFEADFSSAERMTVSINMGDDPIEMDGVKISDETVGMETLRKYTWGKINMSVPGEYERSAETSMMQIFANLQDMMERFEPKFAALDILSVPGYCAVFSPDFLAVIVTEAGTFHDTLGVVTITFPSVGIYLLTDGHFWPVGTLNGELHFGEYHIPEGYLQTSRAVEELYTNEWGGTFSLFANPILYAAFNRAYRAGKPIRLHYGSKTKTYGDYDGAGTWSGQVFYDNFSHDLLCELVEFTPKEDMYVTASVTSGTFNVEVDAEVYEERTKGNLDELTFAFDGTDWTLDDNVVALSDYGIALDGSPTEGDAFTAQLHGDSWGLGRRFICTIPQTNGDGGVTEDN